MAKPVIENVSDTALWVAVYRELETKKKDALFHDPLASVLVGERAKQIEKTMSGGKYTSWSIVIRTRVIDEMLTELIHDEVDTVINLGCGLDTRPYRMDWRENLRWVEVDFPDMINFKTEKLAGQKPKCRLERHAVDLNQDSLRNALFTELCSTAKNVVVLTEGVVPYLDLTQAASLAKGLGAHPQIKHWIIDYFSAEVMRRINTRTRRVQMQNAPFQFMPQDWFQFFRELGWKEKSIKYLPEESLRLGRKVPKPLWAEILTFIFKPKIGSKYLRYMGYVVLEPMK